MYTRHLKFLIPVAVMALIFSLLNAAGTNIPGSAIQEIIGAFNNLQIVALGESDGWKEDCISLK